MFKREKVKVLPIWKSVLEEIVQMNPQPGTRFEKKWLKEKFEIGEPETVEEFERAQLQFLGNIEALKERLLEDHQICLVAERGTYVILHPKYQTRTGINKMVKEFKKAIKKADKTVSNVNRSLLDQKERQENTDGMNKIVNVKALFGDRRKLLGRE